MRFVNRLGSQTGALLVELLVAMAIGLVLMAGVMRVYVDNFSTSRYQENLAAAQEAGRFAMDMISSDLRMAGYAGCASSQIQLTNRLNVSDASRFNFDNIVMGWEAASSAYGAAIPNVTTATSTVASSGWSNGMSYAMPTLSLVPYSDAFRVWGGSPTQTTITGTPGASIPIASGSDIAANQVVIVADCEFGDIVQACGVSGSAISLGSGCSLGNSSTDVTVMKGGKATVLKSVLYAVSKRAADASPSLYRISMENTGNLTQQTELVEGVESMQILYGITTDDENIGAQLWMPASSLTTEAAWGRVVSVKISLLVQGPEDKVMDTPMTYNFNGRTQTATDRRYRQVITKTIALRNRLLGDT